MALCPMQSVVETIELLIVVIIITATMVNVAKHFDKIKYNSFDLGKDVDPYSTSLIWASST